MSQKLARRSSRVSPLPHDGGATPEEASLSRSSSFSGDSTTPLIYVDKSCELNKGRVCLLTLLVLLLCAIAAVLILFFYIGGINECENQPCKFGAICYDHWNDYSCSCNSGYHGYDCDQLLNFCDSNPCQNNASCVSHVGGLECLCQPGFTSRFCKVEINECLSNPCQNFATCIDLLNGYMCQCAEGFTGAVCEYEVDECMSSPCESGGTCINRVNGFLCFCEPGYTDPLCSTEIDECDSNPCNGGSTCVDNVNGFECSCQNGFYGELCQYRYSTMYGCCNNPCMNRGICEQSGDYTCDCLPGYSGRDCHVWDPDANDIVFLMDSSGSMTSVEEEIIEFYHEIVDALDLGETKSKIALTYYLVYQWELDSSISTDREQLKRRFETLEYNSGGYPYEGFYRAYRMLIEQSRNDAPNYVILLSDGGGGDTYHEWVNEVVERAARVLVVGTNDNALRAIENFASYPEDRFTIDQVQDVIAVIQS